MNQVISPRTASRQIVICCDGTNNNLTGRVRDTNVVKFCQLLADDAQSDRIMFYDPGVGNPGELPGATIVDSVKRKSERVAGLAFGRGVYENVADCVLFLMRNYRPGDEIYIFGFSRGAFTARSLGGVINQFGILHPYMESMLPTLLHTYFAERGNSDAQRKAIAKQTSQLFAPADAQYVEIQFVGVWDTVASVGMWPFDTKFTAIPTIVDKRFRNVRQALALDEHRAQFSPRIYIDNNGTYKTEKGAVATMKQLWFRGAHCDVGGGYEGGSTAISDAALAWLVSEATQCGLQVHANGPLLDSELSVSQALQRVYPPSATLTIHSELYNTCLWALTGMAVRDTQRIKLDDGQEHVVEAVEHPSVGANKAAFPSDTSWRAARPFRSALVCLALIPLLLIALGQLLSQPMFIGELVHDAALVISFIPEYLQQNIAFARWQLFWLLDRDLTAGLANFWAPRWALMWDFVLIAAYAYVLAWFAVAAFERNAGLRRVGNRVPPVLARLGWALPIAVFADIGENVATWVTITLLSNELIALAFMAALAMSILSLIKFAGLIGTVMLCVLPTSAIQMWGDTN